MSRTYIPRVGVLGNSIGAFNEKGKQSSEAKFRKLFSELKAEKCLSVDSIYYKRRIFGPEEINEVTSLFARAELDCIIIVNSAFPNGHVYPTLACNPHLKGVPIIVAADKETDLGTGDWTVNSWCGAIMNNYMAKQMGKYIRPLGGDFGSKEFKNELKMLLNCYKTVTLMTKEFVGRFGDAPGGFHSASGNQAAFLATFGVKIDTVDLIAVQYAMKNKRYEGYLGKKYFTDKDVKATIQKMKKSAKVCVNDKMLKEGALLFHAFKVIIEANGYTSAAFRCWPEIQSKVMPFASCFSQSWLASEGLVSASACESDWPTGVLQSIGTYLTGRPAACLDFVNYTAGSEVVQLGHCGVGICGCMQGNGCIAEHDVAKQAGATFGPTLIGQFEYGVKTGMSIVQTKEGKFKMLVFTGENNSETDKRMLYSAADVKVKDHEKLHRLILEHGFTHHLAVTLGDITKELKELCEFYNIEYITL